MHAILLGSEDVPGLSLRNSTSMRLSSDIDTFYFDFCAADFAYTDTRARVGLD